MSVALALGNPASYADSKTHTMRDPAHRLMSMRKKTVACVDMAMGKALQMTTTKSHYGP